MNIDGETIGINVAVRAGAQGIGFAIPIDKVAAVVADLAGSYNSKRCVHGLTLGTKTKGAEQTIVVTSVEPGSPAAAAGLAPGDIIKRAGDIGVGRALDFQRAMLELKPGEKLALSVHRNGKAPDRSPGEDLALSLTLAEPATQPAPAAGSAWDVLGLELRPIPAQDFQQTYPRSRYRGGLTVVAVRPDSPAAAQGIRHGDVLVGMHIWETISLENVNYILAHADLPASNSLKFFIVRGSETLYGYMPVAMRKTAQE